MNVFIDCEWNDYGGDLISIALVPEDGGAAFYGVLPLPKNPTPWVAENVIPVLGSGANFYSGLVELGRAMATYLMQYKAVHVVADWPEDIERFCRLLVCGPGKRWDTPPLSMQIIRWLDARSVVPHNALADAEALKHAYQKAGGVEPK